MIKANLEDKSFATKCFNRLFLFTIFRDGIHLNTIFAIK